jgi:hypothetical protein
MKNIKDLVPFLNINEIERSNRKPGILFIKHINSEKFHLVVTDNIYQSKHNALYSLKRNTHRTSALQELYNKDPNLEMKAIYTNSKETALQIKSEIIIKYKDIGILLNRSCK